MSAAVGVGVVVLDLGTVLCADDETRRAAIEVLIPGDRGATSLVYRTEDGHERRAFVRAPMVAVIPPDPSCSVQCERPSETLVLQMSPEFFAEQANAALGESALRLVARYAAFDPFIREVGNALQIELDRGHPPNAAYLEPLAGVMAVHLARHYSADAANAAAPSGLPPLRLKRVQAFIDEHIAETIHVDQLASEAHMSPFHFARMFKQSTGQPPHLCVVMQRVRQAKTLLRESDLPLIEVAARSGFQTQGHFTSVFHRYTGFTPRKFRLECRAAQAAATA
ncbi:MAG: helix-turn-helix domain-containing protein [Croceibacterium sp.]